MLIPFISGASSPEPVRGGGGAANVKIIYFLCTAIDIILKIMSVDMIRLPCRLDPEAVLALHCLSVV